jgi:hypothetical protein
MRKTLVMEVLLLVAFGFVAGWHIHAAWIAR